MTDDQLPHPPASVQHIVGELASRFPGTPVDIIEGIVKDSLEEVADGARIDTYLPVLAKRVAQARLREEPRAAS